MAPFTMRRHKKLEALLPLIPQYRLALTSILSFAVLLMCQAPASAFLGATEKQLVQKWGRPASIESDPNNPADKYYVYNLPPFGEVHFSFDYKGPSRGKVIEVSFDRTLSSIGGHRSLRSLLGPLACGDKHMSILSNGVASLTLFKTHLVQENEYGVVVNSWLVPQWHKVDDPDYRRYKTIAKSL